MKTKSKTSKKPTKAEREVARNRMLGAHGHTVSHGGTSYRMIVQTVGPLLLADAEPLTGRGGRINVMGQTATARAIRDLCLQKIYH
jgi:hemin uptake protein HemP